MQFSASQMVPVGKSSGDVPMAVMETVDPISIANCATQNCFQHYRKHKSSYRCSFCKEFINSQSPLESLIKLNKTTTIVSLGCAAEQVDAVCILCFPRYLMSFDTTPCTAPSCAQWHALVSQSRPIPTSVTHAIQQFANAVVLPNAVSAQLALTSGPPGLSPLLPPPPATSNEVADLLKKVNELSERVSALEAVVRKISNQE
jgi:hypothetical protein